MDHFAAVGFAVGEDEEARKGLIVAALERASAAGDVVQHANGSTATYRDPSGALFTIHRNLDGALECGKPGFESSAVARWRPVHVVRDPECAYCDLVYAELLDDADEMVYPFPLSVETIGADRALIPFEETGEVRFAALCEDGEVWADEATFFDAQVMFDSRSVISSGTFGEPMTSHVYAHGLVASVEERRNELGGAPFRVVGLDTSGGVFDMCVAPGTLEREELLAPGAVVAATLWLVGRPLTLRDEAGPVPEVPAQVDEKGPSAVGRLFRRLLP